MNRLTLLLALALGLVAFQQVVFQQSVCAADDKPQAAAIQNDRDNNRSGNDTATVVVGRRIWFLFFEEPDKYFQKAADAYKEHDLKRAAADLRRAATILKIEAAGAERAERAPLEGAIFDLELLADEVFAGRVKSEKSL